MSLITQCPACTTLFKVVQDQLRISEGWVRCGQCDEVFDANAHLQSKDALSIPAVDQIELDADVASPNPPPESALAEEPLTALLDHPIEAPSPIDNLNAPDLEVVVAPHELAVDGDQAAPLRADVQPKGLSFMKDSAQRVTRYGAFSAWLWGGSLFLLTGLLSVQVVVQERDRLAAMEPELRPMLESLCGALGCELSHLRQIESVVIESSSFVNVQGSVYRLNATLKNTGPFAVELPAMELTLTDLQDQAVIRRVIAVSEFGSVSRALSAGGELQATFPLGVKLSNGSEKFSGYRLVIFYP